LALELRILVTGGGTGGHTLPALATIAAIRKQITERPGNISLHFLYVGSKLGLEARLAGEADVDFVSIATGKLRRASNPLRMINRTNIVDAFRVPMGFLQALKIVAGFHPNVVFSTGGYVSIPAVFAAKLLNIPILMHEQTVQIGLANRWSAHAASQIALTFSESCVELNAKDRTKAFVTGGVVRKIVLAGDADRGRQRFGFTGDLADLPVVYITGGAQGSSVINTAVRDSLSELLTECCIIHQCGTQRGSSIQDEDLLKAAAAALPEAQQIRYYVTPFIGDEIGDVYALADLVVGRSGAGTISEVCAAGKASLFVPLVPTGGDEQTRNAKRLQSIGAADILTQSEINGISLVERIKSLLSDRLHLQAMGEAALSQSRPDAAEVLADAVIKLGLGIRTG
jgi:UDP-N-acetylglucosamine--N-acetylmuramyl-(pentapeptide) pyrophosphoryl-undecaprenol N-acetylglucosamine transferase